MQHDQSDFPMTQPSQDDPFWEKTPIKKEKKLEFQSPIPTVIDLTTPPRIKQKSLRQNSLETLEEDRDMITFDIGEFLTNAFYEAKDEDDTGIDIQDLISDLLKDVDFCHLLYKHIETTFKIHVTK